MLAPVPAPGRGSGSLVGWILGFVLPLGPRPFDHRRDLLGQPGQVLVFEGLDVWVGRGPLHPDGGPAALDGHDDLQVLGRAGLVSNGLSLAVVNALRLLCGLLVGVLLIGRSAFIERRVPDFQGR